MTKFQCQVQEDLVTDFNSTYDTKGVKNAIVMSKHCDTEPSKVGGQIVKDQFFDHIEREPAESAWSPDDNCWHIYEREEIFRDFPFRDFFAHILRSAKVFCIKKAESLRNVHSFTDMLVWFAAHERELKILSSLCLIFYGGCWRNLAPIFAAGELFGTRKAVEEVVRSAWRLVKMKERKAITPTKINKMVEEAFLMGKRPVWPEHLAAGVKDVTPVEIKEAMNELGLQVGLMVAVAYCPGWADICIALAFASRVVFTTFADDGTLWDRAIELSFTVSASFVFYGYCRRLVVALYMGFLGFSLLLEATGDGGFKVGEWDFHWAKSETRYYVLFANCAVSLWQAYANYGGIFQAFSGFMMLLPLAQCWNLLQKKGPPKFVGERVKTE